MTRTVGNPDAALPRLHLLHSFTLTIRSLPPFFFFQAEDGIRDRDVTGVQTCALPISLLTQLMAKAMNRPLSNILFTPMVTSGPGEAISGSMKEVGPIDAAAMMRYASKVIIVPGYGMAVAHAQHKVWEMTSILEEAGVEVKFAIHPVAGRMPGHMNVLLAEAGVPYDKIFDLEKS